MSIARSRRPAAERNAVERPYINENGERIRALMDRHWDDFWELGLAVHEAQFRSLIERDRKAAGVARLIELAIQADRRRDERPTFDFPTTDVAEIRRKRLGGMESVDWREEGLLSMSGYRVGVTQGEPERLRRLILNYIFTRDTLDDVSDRAYAETWGEPRSSARLEKLSNTIASLARNAKRSPANLSRAIEEWEGDLQYLKETFYDRWGDFPWPEVEV